jgi:hypothetical protein
MVKKRKEKEEYLWVGLVQISIWKRVTDYNTKPRRSYPQRYVLPVENPLLSLILTTQSVSNVLRAIKSVLAVFGENSIP